MRNPWGTEDYKGDWCDSSSLWTDDLRRQAGSAVANDGEFFMTVADYRLHVSYTKINFNADNLSRAHHLTLGDAENNSTGTYFCKECTAHSYTLTSDTDQTVRVISHTWDARGTPNSCQAQFEKEGRYWKHYHYGWFNGG